MCIFKITQPKSMLSLLCFSECKCIYVGMNLNLYCMCSCKSTCSAKEYVLKGGEQLTEAWWVFEFVIVHHHHFGSSEAEHSKLGCMMSAAIWLWMGLLRETQAGASLQNTLPACLRMRMTCPSMLQLCVSVPAEL